MTMTMMMVMTTTMSDTELVPRLRLAVMRLSRRLRQEAETGTNPSMLSALASIERLGPLTLGELAEVERVQPPTITRVVARLAEERLVAKEADAEDRRVTRVRLTQPGRQLLERARKRKNAYLAKQLRRLDEADLAKLSHAVEVLERILEEDR